MLDEATRDGASERVGCLASLLYSLIAVNKRISGLGYPNTGEDVEETDNILEG